MRAEDGIGVGVACAAGRARRDLLRAATATDHGWLDAEVAAWLNAPRAAYSDFLSAHFAALSRIEPALERATPCSVLDDWPQRRKLPLLSADLDALGLALPPLPSSPEPRLGGPARVLGALYVVEGATLGGAVLERLVRRRFPESAGATRYLASYGAARGAMWRRFLAILEASEAARADQPGLVEGARAAFSCFVEAFSGLRGASATPQPRTIGPT